MCREAWGQYRQIVEFVARVKQPSRPIDVGKRPRINLESTPAGLHPNLVRRRPDHPSVARHAQLDTIAHHRVRPAIPGATVDLLRHPTRRVDDDRDSPASPVARPAIGDDQPRDDRVAVWKTKQVAPRLGVRTFQKMRCVAGRGHTNDEAWLKVERELRLELRLTCGRNRRAHHAGSEYRRLLDRHARRPEQAHDGNTYRHSESYAHGTPWQVLRHVARFRDLALLQDLSTPEPWPWKLLGVRHVCPSSRGARSQSYPEPDRAAMSPFETGGSYPNAMITRWSAELPPGESACLPPRFARPDRQRRHNAPLDARGVAARRGPRTGTGGRWDHDRSGANGPAARCLNRHPRRDRSHRGERGVRRRRAIPDLGDLTWTVSTDRNNRWIRHP